MATYLFKNGEPKLFKDHEVKQAIVDGWKDTPAIEEQKKPPQVIKRGRNGNRKTTN